MNPLLQQHTAKTMEQADPRLRTTIKKVFESGKQIMYGEQTRKLVLQQLKHGHDPEAIGAGIAKLLGIMMSKNPRIPMQVAIPASMLLLDEALQFLEDAGTVKVDAQFLAACGSATGSSILQMLKASPDALQAFVDKGGKAAPAAPAASQPAPAQPAGLVAGAMGAPA